MINFLLQHRFWAAVILYWIFSAAVSLSETMVGVSRSTVATLRFSLSLGHDECSNDRGPQGLPDRSL